MNHYRHHLPAEIIDAQTVKPWQRLMRSPIHMTVILTFVVGLCAVVFFGLRDKFDTPPSAFKEAGLDYMGKGVILQAHTVTSMCLRYKPGTRDTPKEECDGPPSKGYVYVIRLDNEGNRAVPLRTNFAVTGKMFSPPEVYIYRYPDGNYIFAPVRGAS